jgi:FkbM family methyltransferase
MKTVLKKLLRSCGLRLTRTCAFPEGTTRTIYESYLGHEHNFDCIFDVGANVGQTSKLLIEQFPEATIYAFEPIGDNYSHLSQLGAKFSRVKTFNCALGAKEGVVSLPMNLPPLSQLYSLTPGVNEVGLGQALSETIQVTTVDRICSKNSIGAISLLKTDTEGYDLEVLKGAEQMLRKGLVGFVLSEVGLADCARRHTPLEEQIAFLSRYGFRLCALYDLEYWNGGRFDYGNALFMSNVTF